MDSNFPCRFTKKILTICYICFFIISALLLVFSLMILFTGLSEAFIIPLLGVIFFTLFGLYYRNKVKQMDCSKKMTGKDIKRDKSLVKIQMKSFIIVLSIITVVVLVPVMLAPMSFLSIKILAVIVLAICWAGYFTLKKYLSSIDYQ